MGKIIVVILVITFISIFIFTKIDPRVANDVTSLVSSGDDAFITVSVSGAVTHPATYVLAKDATIDDLLTKAGGATTKADARAYITTTELIGGQSYYIAPLFDENDVCNEAELEKVNINHDLKDKLMTVNGIGSTVASAIISYRQTQGSFDYLEEVLNVSGIGNATFEKIKNYIILQ